jgi:acetolactate synthase-1/2/3 large subunit
MTQTVADHIYKILSQKVSTAYLFSGGSIMSLIDKFHISNNMSNIKYFVPTSEASAGFCSIGHNKSLNKIDSVIITTSGPGLTNVLTPLTDAKCDKVPLLVISGDVPTNMMGKGAFQEAPSMELTKPITNWNHNLIDPNNVENVFDYAFELLRENKQVHINIPKDIISKLVSESYFDHHKLKYLKYSPYSKNNMFDIDLVNQLNQVNNFNQTDIIKIASIINKSNNPVFYVGRGCNEASNILAHIAIKANIPVTTTLHGLGIFNEHHHLSLKMLGMHGSVRANNAIQSADCIICVGARFDDRTTGNIDKYAPNATNIIHINTDSSEFDKVVKGTININGSSLSVLNDLEPLINHNSRKLWLAHLETFPIDFYFNQSGLKQQHILKKLNNILDSKSDIKSNTIFTTGVGNHQMFAAQLIDHIIPNHFITSGSLGTMGSANSMAIGAKIANPDKYVISIDGDQSFNMMNDLKMILNYNIPIKMVIMNDSKQSMVNVWEKLFFNNNITATESINPNYYYLAKAYGIKCINIDKSMNKDEIYTLIEEFIEYDNTKPIMLNCIVDSDYCLPLVSPGKGLDEMITYDNFNKLEIDKNNIPS